MVEETALMGGQSILGRRHVSIDIVSLCDHLDVLVGPQVAEVIMKHHEVRLGKEDVAFLRKQHPEASPNEIVEKLVESSRISGVGSVEAKLKDNGPELEIIIQNPCLTGTEGSAKSFMFAHWCGALSAIAKGGEFEVMHVTYDPYKKVLRGRIVPRRPPTNNSRHVAGPGRA
ncbi:MAG TPA: hypothetical protein VLV18_04180 [Terriglobales bacterium]|nr:hypothetical protein [Terriglobales bacterium]